MNELIIVLIILCVVCIGEWMREIHTFKMTHYDISSLKLQGLKDKKIILLSDLHNCNYGRKNDKLLRARKRSFLS